MSPQVQDENMTNENQNQGLGPLIEVEGLKKYFPIRKGIFSRHVGDVKAVDGLSFEIGHKETLSLVGESGCGKTTAGRTLLRLLEPTAGRATYYPKGQPLELFELSGRQMKNVRRDLQIIFQDPYSSLDPRMTAGDIVGELLGVYDLARGKERDERVAELFARVGLRRDQMRNYPHEFSGGQRQRIGIARALSLNPRLIICDEPVSALDVSIQAQVINLLEDLREEFGLTYLFIAHDLSVVHHLCNREAVMYLGKMVELAESDELFDTPIHPYTKALLSAVPVPDPTAEKHREHQVLQGEVPSPMNPPSGCVFHPRCPMAVDSCRLEIPPLVEKRPGHWVACSQV